MAFISLDDEAAKKSFTVVENKFITKYLPVLEAGAVKIYLFALYLSQSGQSLYTIGDMAKKLETTEEQVENYFKYLEEFELVSIISSSPFEVKILDCDNVYGKPKKLNPEKYSGFSTEVQSIITGRMISTNEFMEYYYLLEEYGFERNALLMIINYCVSMKGNDIRFQYIKKVAKSFAAEGITTAKKAEEKLSAYTSSTPALVRIFSACGINRRPDYTDDKFYAKWSSEYGFSDDAIIAAAKYFKAKSSEKIDAALSELYKNRKFDVKEIEDYCKNKNSLYTAALDVAKALGVFVQNPAPYIENYVSVWCNFGFDCETLKLIANYCFIRGKNSFEAMNDFTLSLYDDGIVTEKAVSDKLSSLAAEDKLIKNILSTCGLTRKIIASDRECLKRWRDWGFSDDMLFKAAELSSGKNNPIAYMNGVLSSWKIAGTVTLESLNNVSLTSPVGTESKRAIIERHYYDLRAKAERKAEAALKKAADDKIYGEIRRKINSLSIQLAFAEIKDAQKAEELSSEITTLEKQGDERLAKLKIDKEQFVPQYKCKVCGDTGYDKSGKQCDCLIKFIKDNNL